MSDDHLNKLNEKQREAVLYDGGSLLILAGAGSGKTMTIAYRASHFIESGKATPDQVLLVTFTNKAAGEMKERVAKISGHAVGGVGTFHSLGARILRKDGYHVGVDTRFVIYDESDQVALVKDIVDVLRIDDKRFRPKSLLYTILQAKQEMIDPNTYERIAKGNFQEVVARVYREYEKRLAKYGALDFEDLLTKSVMLFKQNNTVLDQYREKYKYIFVDEYQDTNGAQYLMTKLLVGPRDNLTVVGDASQSIYKWRGADYRNIKKLISDFPNIKEVRLERNYRSSQNILDAAHQVISNNKNHPILSLWTDSGAGEKIGIVESYSGREEAEWVVNKIQEAKRREKLQWNDIAILYRTNAQSRELEEALIRSSVPYVLIGGVKFYERAEVKDMISYFRIINNPKDLVSRKRAEKIGKRRLENLTSYIDREEVVGLAPKDIFAIILEKTQYLNKYDEEVEEDQSRIENVRELEAVSGEFETVADFLENVALVQSEYYQGEKDAGDDAVTLMTLHASKGLEFPIVCIVGMEEGLFPHSRSMEGQEELEEERRLCYVGITRAKNKLFLTYAKRRTVWGNSSLQIRSRFIDEIAPSLFERNIQKSDSSRLGGGVKIDALSDETLEKFLDGEIDIEKLLS